MPSLIAHAVAGAAVWPIFRTESLPSATWIAGVALAALPDLDVIGFTHGVPYASILGHRGLTHSLTFAALMVCLTSFSWRCVREISRRDMICLWTYLFVAAASHGLLDAITDGGLGVALLAPFNKTRFFLPWRPIAVSPIGLSSFFTTRGAQVLANEALWIGLPAAFVAGVGTYVRRTAFSARSGS